MTRNDKNPYKLSRDYARLKTLVDSGWLVICFVDYIYGEKRKMRDACTLYLLKSEENKLYDNYMFSVRGCCYGNLYPNDKTWGETFEHFCEWLNVEFIDPEL